MTIEKPPLLTVSVDSKFSPVFLDHVNKNDLLYFIAHNRQDSDRLNKLFKAAKIQASVAFLDNMEEADEQTWLDSRFDAKSFGFQRTLFDCINGPPLAKCYLARFAKTHQIPITDTRIDSKRQTEIEALLKENYLGQSGRNKLKSYILGGTNTCLTFKIETFSQSNALSIKF